MCIFLLVISMDENIPIKVKINKETSLLLNKRQAIAVKLLHLEQDLIDIDKELCKHSIISEKEIGKYLLQIERKTKVIWSTMIKGVQT